MDINYAIASFQLLGSCIKKLNIKNDIVMIDDPSNFKKNIDIDYYVETIEKDEDGDPVGILTLMVTVEYKSKFKKKLNIKLELEGCFISQGEITDEKFEEMLTLNGSATLFSIARSIIADVSAQSLTYGKIMLPMVNVNTFVQNKKQIQIEKELQSPDSLN